MRELGSVFSILGCRQAVRQRTLTPSSRGFESRQPSQRQAAAPKSRISPPWGSRFLLPAFLRNKLRLGALYASHKLFDLCFCGSIVDGESTFSLLAMYPIYCVINAHICVFPVFSKPARASASHLVEAVKLLYLGFPFYFPAHTNTRQFPLGSFFAFAIITPPYKDAALLLMDGAAFLFF